MTVTLLTVAEVADRLRVSESSVYRWIERGDLVATKIVGSWRIRSTEIDRLLAGGAIVTEAAS